MGSRVKTLSILCASLLLGSLALGCGKSNDANAKPASSGTAAAAPAETAAGRVVEVKVTNKGFEPKVIEAKKGETISLKLTRETESECLKAMAIPSMKIEKDLPLNQPVIVNVKADNEGTIGFQCWMAMFKGEIDVKN